MKRKYCRICGEYSGKRGICINCKKEYPYRPSGKGDYPFERSKEVDKKRKRKFL